MANETLSILKEAAKIEIVGKSWPDTSFDSGDGGWDDTYDGTYDGEIPRTDLPTKIKIAIPPSKTVFDDGDPITFWDYFDIVVFAYKEDGTIWDDDGHYPSGRVFAEDIEVEPTVVSINGAAISVTTDLDISPWEQPFPVADSLSAVTETFIWSTTGHTARVTYVAESGTVETVITGGKGGDNSVWWQYASPTPGTGLFRYLIDDLTTGERHETVIEYELRSSITIGGKTAYYTGGATYIDAPLEEISIDAGPQLPGTKKANLAWAMLYSKRQYTGIVTVKWRRPYDGVELTDSYEITITAAEERGNGGR